MIDTGVMVTKRRGNNRIKKEQNEMTAVKTIKIDDVEYVRADAEPASSVDGLSGSNLQPIRDDFWAVLCSAPNEVAGLRQALVEGKVDGSTYTGECACLVGTIAHVRKTDYTSLGLLRPRSSRPAERWFLGINEGDTPETSEISKITVEWLDIWVEQMTSAFGVK